MNTKNSLLYIALITALAFHGSTLFFTLESTYDALIHLFFADHYANSWFDPWEYRWYTGFTVQSYPPLVHQSIALLSYIAGLKFGLFTVAFCGIILFITGIYRFALMLTGNYSVAGYTAILACFSTTFIETLHLFGQLPSIVGVSVLLHSLPKIYLWIKTGKRVELVKGLSLIALTVTSHHVTPIFGMVFFIFPLIGMAVMDLAREQVDSFKAIRLLHFWIAFKQAFWRIVVFGGCSLFLIVFCILPYWINSKKNPITQVAIPHGSRDNFIEVGSSGLVFFLIPWGVMLFIIPYLFYRFFSKRYVFFGLSLALLSLLGTGGTTPLPRMMLGETAFNILTLDRFTLWATILALPIFGELVYRLAEGDLKAFFTKYFSSIYHRLIGGFMAVGLLFMVVFTVSLSYFRPSQPEKINMLPIINFLHQDQHYHWRYLTLGFGDQMAWLSAQTSALTVDGNYHSARRLPELTTRAVERLENSKFRGIEGIGSLQQFLVVPEKYNLKYIFSNDKFYDPLLYFCGWQRLSRLENGIQVWEKLGVPPLSKILPKDESSKYINLMWGINPILTLILAFIISILRRWYLQINPKKKGCPDYLKFTTKYERFPGKLAYFNHVWAFMVIVCLAFGIHYYYMRNTSHVSPENIVNAYYDALDFKEFERAFSYLDPDSGEEMDMYMQKIAVTDGLLSSYAKLDSIGTTIIDEKDNKAIIKVVAKWVTPLEVIQRTYRREVVKHNAKWYIKPLKYGNYIPPNQFYSGNKNEYYNHGRRRITTQQTNHEDALKQPVIEILSAKLVQLDSVYAIVGEIQNVDNVPADVNIKVSLYNQNDHKLASYNSKYMIKHKLMPKETSVFRVDFEGIAWSGNSDTKPTVFNPDEFTSVDWLDKPQKFNIQCEGNIAITDLYKSLNLQGVQFIDSVYYGSVFNSGLQETTVPQVIVSYYNTEKEPIWIDNIFITESARIHRPQTFKYKPVDLSNLQIISSDISNCFVNGLSNKTIGKILFPYRNNDNKENQLLSYKNDKSAYLKFETNSYIGNPR